MEVAADARASDSLRHQEVQNVRGVISNERHSTISVANIARKWNIGMDSARATLKATTQHGVRHTIYPLTRRYRTDILQPRLRKNNSTIINSTIYTDTLFRSSKLLQGTCDQVFMNGRFVDFQPMRSKGEAGHALVSFTQDVGVPRKLVF